jgi:hypothetical protein
MLWQTCESIKLLFQLQVQLVLVKNVLLSNNSIKLFNRNMAILSWNYTVWWEYELLLINLINPFCSYSKKYHNIILTENMWSVLFGMQF